MDQKQRDALRAKWIAEIKIIKYSIIGAAAFLIILIITVAVLLIWSMVSEKKGQALTIKNKGDTTIAYGVEMQNKCFEQLQNFISRNGADYSRCLVGFDFNEEYCGGFNPDTQGLSDINLIVILDSSGSMAEEINSRQKIDIAKEAVSDFMTKMPKGVKTGLVVYGHKGSNSSANKGLSCKGIEEIIKLGVNNTDSIISAMDSFKPQGWTPIAESFNFAKNIFKKDGIDNKNYLILVSDGIESCDGNPLIAAEDLKLEVPGVKLNIIGFSNDYQTRASLEKIATWGGGSYISAGDSSDIASAFNDQLLVIKKDCLKMTLFKAFSMNNTNSLNNLNCWLDSYNKESQDFKANISKTIDAECSSEVSEALLVKDKEFWNKKQDLEEKNNAIYKNIESNLNSQLKELEAVKN